MQFFVANYFILATLVFIGVFASEEANDDEIKQLPGLKDNVTFRHFSGYLQVSETHFLHYWFVESQYDLANAPLIFWYNGGPGCSSMEGLLHEMGPYQINSNGKTLRKNPNSWNNFASIVYIEAPAGVGYSYATDGNITTSDDLTTEENYEGIKQFFKKYPYFRNHSTFIMGESYGGIYVPLLTAKIIENQTDFPINLGGMAIGNGLLNYKLNRETQLQFLYAHGMIDELKWNQFEKTCCNGCVETCDLGNITLKCLNILDGGISNVNPYDIYGKCEGSNKKFDLMEGILIQDLLLSSSQRYLKKSFSLKNEERNIIPCFNLTDITTYMNLPYLRKALHIPENLPKWEICNEKVHNSYNRQYLDMTPFFKKVHKANVRVLLYYGDTDLMCNFMMGQKFAAQLRFDLISNSQAWEVNGQTAGFKTVYDNLAFTTIRGAGHMAPQYRAPETAKAVLHFVLNPHFDI
uniref:Carboxypeptidase n=1 Tax=Panagrolaimus sp. ES5 TaxID=591445 RepID=A0AC34FVJ7_9BILA